MKNVAASSETPPEPIIEPELPIVDAHHHLWLQSEALLTAMAETKTIAARELLPVYRGHARYLFDEYMADLRSGHNIRASVFIDAHVMYKATGPIEMRSVGEVEFVNGVAAMSASGGFGDVRLCAGIVGGGVDLTLGEGVEAILRSHINAGGGRYRGLRAWAFYDADSTICGPAAAKPHILLDSKFRSGFRCLHPLGLSFDALVLEPQLPDVIDLARAFPDTQIILNHMGTPMGVGRYAGRRQERFSIWQDNIRALSRCANVSVKLGGIGTFFAGFGYDASTRPVSSSRLADDWRPYIEACIEDFGVSRCMFESNFPVDSGACNYSVIWNAFKRITSGASKAEKEALYSATATRIYRLDLS
jgi:L-fuconolactonase